MSRLWKPPFRRARLCDCRAHGFVGLTFGQVSLFSPGDLDHVAKFFWSALRAKGRFYARRTEQTTSNLILMHREITCPAAGQHVDHINHDSTDNRRENLRKCSPSDNLANSRKKRTAVTSQYKGVSLEKSGRWKACILVKGTHFHLGSHDSEEDAARAYDEAALKYRGEFACTNASLGLLSEEAA